MQSIALGKLIIETTTHEPVNILNSMSACEIAHLLYDSIGYVIVSEMVLVNLL